MAEEKKEVKDKVEEKKEHVVAKEHHKVEAKPTAEHKTEEKKEVKVESKPFVKAYRTYNEKSEVSAPAQTEESKPVIVKKYSPFKGFKMFGKWTCDDVIVSDPSLINYINLDPMIVPHSFGKKSQSRFGKTNINVVERLVNKTMRSGQGKRKLSGKYIRGRKGCGKKLQTMGIVQGAFEIIELKTKKNPIQVLVDAIQYAAPREDITRVKKGGIAYSVAVDVAPMKRLDEAIKNIALAGFGNSFKSKTDAASALAEEIIAASTNDNKSLAVKRRDEVERIAKASR